MPLSQDHSVKTTQSNNDLLPLIRQFGKDLRVRPEQMRRLHLDSRLDTDLGLDSLTRMEMLTRVEDHFDVALSEAVYARIETPRDLWREIQNASPNQQLKSVLLKTDTSEQNESDIIAYEAQTLVDILEWHVQTHPERTHITLYSDLDDGQKITFQDLKSASDIMAAGLQQNGLKAKQTVAIMLPTGKDYFVSFFAILIAGAIPVPLYPPARRAQIEEHLVRHQRILENCQAVMLITTDEDKPFADVLTSQLNHLQRVLTPLELTAANGTLLRPRISSQDIAFLQYTSGSTGTPKGVMLTHHNLLSNVHAMGERVGAKSSDVYVSWLPLYHDMGLIGAWFGSLYYSMHFVVMSPLSFLSRPSRWLRAIHQYRGTLTGAPNFAFELCLQRVKGTMLTDLDLSSVRCMFNGAEPISPPTLLRFNQMFKACGLVESAMQPVYGLAECSVGLTFPNISRPPLIDQIERITFMKSGHAIPVTDQTEILKFPSCGVPLIGHEIRVVDASGRELPERQQGRLEFQGSSATSGYFRNPEQSRKLFHGDWLDSGDLAYIADGELYITGRVKDIVIHAGRNIYPHELEHAVGELANIRNGCVAVFGSQNSETGTERLIILAECKNQDTKVREQLISNINGIASTLIGSPADEVVLAPPHTVLKTSSGKIRRTSCRELYEQGLVKQSTAQNMKLYFARLLLKADFSRIKRGFNLLITGLFGLYAWTILLLSSIVSWPLVVILPNKCSWPILRLSFRILTFLCNTKITIQGLDNLKPKQGPFIFVCNHASYLDSMILILTIPMEFSFVAKAELNQQFIAGILLRKIGTKFVERFDTMKSITDAKKITMAATEGRSLLFFPEGTFTRVPGLRPLHMGAFTAAVESNRPVLPIAIRGTRSILRAKTWLPRRGSITVNIGKVITSDSNLPGIDRSEIWNSALKIRDAARAHILRHNGEPDLADEF